MLHDKKIALAWFSGTGGTKMAAGCLADDLAALGGEVSSIRISKEASGIPPGTEMLGVLFPVHAFHEPEPVRKYLETLPMGGGMPAFVLSVSGGGEMCPNTASRVSVVRQLSRKGYQVSYEGMIVMPANIGVSTGFPLNRLLLDILPLRTQAIAGALDRGESRHPKILAVDRLFARTGKIEERGGRFFGRRIRVKAACTGCGLCSRNCPTGNIVMSDDRPVFGKNCAFCLGCLYCCPVDALEPGVFKAAKIPGGFSIEKINGGPTVPEGYSSGNMRPGVLWSGVVRYVKETMNGQI